VSKACILDFQKNSRDASQMPPNIDEKKVRAAKHGGGQKIPFFSNA
jgi:hypothetical protein